MPRSFALSLDAPVAVDEILAAFADGVGEEEQPGTNVTTSAAATLSASRRAKARCCAARRLFSLGVPGNVEHNFELQQ